MKYEIGQKVTLKPGVCEFDATEAIIKNTHKDGTYLVENTNPYIFGWFNEDQIEAKGN